MIIKLIFIKMCREGAMPYIYLLENMATQSYCQLHILMYLRERLAKGMLDIINGRVVKTCDMIKQVDYLCAIIEMLIL